VTEYFWLGTTTDNANGANWSLATGGAPAGVVPGTGDTATFDGNGNNACTWTAGMTLGGLSVVAGYTATLNLATFNLTMDDGANITLAGGGTFNCGSGSHSITNGTFTFSAQTTWTTGTAAWTFNGTCSIVPKLSYLYSVTIAASGTTTISAAQWLRVQSQITVNGTLLLNHASYGVLMDYGGGILVTGASSRIGGTGIFNLTDVGAGKGYTSRGANTTIDVAQFRIRPIATSPTLPVGTYSGLVTIQQGNSVNSLMTLSTGAYVFGSLKFQTPYATRSLTVDCATNAVTSITVNGDMTVDIDVTGPVVVTSAGRATNWTITGNVVDEVTGAGTFTWTAGTGTMTINGTGAQNLDFMGQTIEPLGINKVSGDTTMSGAVTAASFTGTSTGTGTFDPNGQTITTVGNCDWAAAFDFNAAADCLNGCAWVIGGDFTCDGQTLNATAAWTLSVTGSAVASGVGSVAHSDARGGTQIDASSGPWTKDVNTFNWNTWNSGQRAGSRGRYLRPMKNFISFILAALPWMKSVA